MLPVFLGAAGGTVCVFALAASLRTSFMMDYQGFSRLHQVMTGNSRFANAGCVAGYAADLGARWLR